MQPIDRKYEKFLAGENKASQDIVYVSLSKNNLIKLNRTAHRELGSAPAVCLYYSSHDDTIAIEPVSSPRLPATFRVKPSGSGSFQINAAPFCRHHNIQFEATRRFITPDIRDGRLYVDLGRTIIVQHPKKKRKG